MALTLSVLSTLVAQLLWGWPSSCLNVKKAFFFWLLLHGSFSSAPLSDGKMTWGTAMLSPGPVREP